MPRFFPLALSVLLMVAPSARSQGTDAEGEKFFETRIRPVLAEHCFQCHSQKAQKLRGGLLMDSRESMRQGGDSGPIIVPGQPEKSLIIHALRQEKDLAMPPKGKLPEAVIADFVRWIEMGAPDPRVASKATPRRVFKITEADRKHWSFQPIPQVIPSPTVKNQAWCRSGVDSFILAGLEQKGLKPSAPADRYALMRRATFDLTGLPPTPKELQDFVSDTSAQAFEKVVDRLLASKEFGVRWGRHWLDGVRYASDVDKSGRYRDWVVNALNQDMPYFKFVRLQIAGDLIPAEETAPSRVHASGASLEGVTATGMLALAVWEKVGRDLAVAEIVDTQIDVVGRQLLGLTLACARCHDHKFDPISNKDYYGLAGIFFSSHISPGNLIADGRLSDEVIDIPLLTKADSEKNRRIEDQISDLQREIAEVASKTPAEADGPLQVVLGKETNQKPLSATAAANPATKAKLKQAQDEKIKAARKELEKMAPELLAAISKLQGDVQALEKSKASPPHGHRRPRRGREGEQPRKDRRCAASHPGRLSQGRALGAAPLSRNPRRRGSSPLGQPHHRQRPT